MTDPADSNRGADPARWFPYQTESGRPVFYWLPHSGGSAARAAQWIGQIGDDVAVCPIELPGRGGRRAETPYTDMESLVTDLAPAILDHRDGRPWAIGGHSLGALVAFETAHAIRRLGGGEPGYLIVSCCTAPQQIRPDDPPISSLDDEALSQHLRRLGGTPEHILSHRIARHLLLATFRPDAAIRDGWRYQQYSPLLGMPITAFAAEQDPRATPVSMQPWRAQSTSDSFSLHQTPGGHFAVLDAQETCSLLSKALT